MSMGADVARLLLVVAMEAEARPVRTALGLGDDGAELHPAFPARLYTGEVSGVSVGVAVNGTDPRYEVESIASQPAVTTTLHAVESFTPDLVVSAGTCGGFAAHGSDIAEVIVADRVIFHDRRIAIPGWDAYGVGDYPVVDLSAVAAQHGWRTGPVTTGNALDAPPVDMATMTASGAMAKEMEAAAVAWVCERMAVPFGAVKVVTDLVDHHEATAEQFDRNLQKATATLAEAVRHLVASL